ncbi:heparinase II/III family protein [Paucibacter sp. R3-3]|uniref:Heparinase II/III family protein n=1 Tax=Roseateles agri TaxID=3098619 RepID=A0ABU5DDG9_9BURK|nr:heparinase II/III family protein [Paucibacter sp. R3-3]MDY0743851.1 heparinase II/III family protein [Paucibacter sp. R3-3]
MKFSLDRVVAHWTFARTACVLSAFIAASALAATQGLSVTTIRAGTGLSEADEPACVPGEGDFMDRLPLHARRVAPRDCATVDSKTPQFSWAQPGDRDPSIPWAFTLRRAGSHELVAVRTIPVPRISLSQPKLAPGNYEWDVVYTTKSGRQTRSGVRRFQVAGDVPVDWPSGADVAARVAERPHPRMLPTGTSFARIGDLAKKGELKGAFAGLTNTAMAAATAPPLVEPTAGRSAYATEAAYAAAVNNSKNLLALERRRIEALGLLGRFAGNDSYTSKGVARLMSLATWNPDGITSEAAQDQSNREIYLALAQGLDLYAEQLGPSDVALIVKALRSRLAQARRSQSAVDTYPYNPHPLTAGQYVLEALLYSVGTPGFPEASAWLSEAYEDLINTTDTFMTDDGGYGNGVAYAWYAMTTLPYSMAALKIMAGVDLTQHPAVAQFGEFLIAFTAPAGSHMSAFGDGAELTDNYQRFAWESFRLYAALMQKPMYDWYWRFAASNVNKTAYPGAWPFMVLGSEAKTASTPKAPTRQSWVFPDAGMAALHSDSASPQRTSIYFRSSRFGSFNHSHADQNSFALVSHGRSLLVSGGYYPYYMSPHHANVTRATRYKNALTFDGGIGQAEPVTAPTSPGRPLESMEASGRLTNAFDNGEWAIVTGDATRAYQGYDNRTKAWVPLLSNAIRTVAYQRQLRVVVIYDWATSGKPRRWELNFNALNSIAVDGGTARITNETSSACMEVYGPDGAFATTKGFAIAPEVPSPDQYQLRFTAAVASQQLGAVTVIREDCRPLKVSVDWNGTTASVSLGTENAASFSRGEVTLR